MTPTGNFIAFLVWTLIFVAGNYFVGTSAHEIINSVVLAALIWATVLHINRQ